MEKSTSVREKLIPTKKHLAMMRRDARANAAEVAENAIAMLEEIRHDAREGWLEKYHGEPIEGGDGVNIYRAREAGSTVYIVACVRHGEFGPIGQRFWTLDSARFAAAQHQVSHKEKP